MRMIYEIISVKVIKMVKMANFDLLGFCLSSSILYGNSKADQLKLIERISIRLTEDFSMLHMVVITRAIEIMTGTV